MPVLTVILLVAAFILFVLAAVGVASPPRFNFMAAGLAFWVLSVLMAGVRI
jgi:hypothetical protein